MKVVLALAAAITTIVAAAFWFEHQQAIDGSAASIAWGSAGVARVHGDDMVVVPGGGYAIGDESPHARGDAPLRWVPLASFAIDRHEVTNRQFAAFVRATGYVTTAERRWRLDLQRRRWQLGLPAWRGLAPSARSGQQHRSRMAAPGRARFLVRRERVRPMGGGAVAGGERMGSRCPRRASSWHAAAPRSIA